ncbi:hypothetical protein V1L52_01185 [Treponema sp. HNW]|uniref:hypothetical protein n=1 Tax=Treponema sp. HNW TaxID=3116654 RepID=UPI003D0E929C
MFFSMIFYTDKKGRGIWTISPLFRAFMLAVFLLSAAALFFPAESETGSTAALSFIIPAFFLLLSLLGLLYRDCCIFEPDARMLIFKTGLIFLSKRRLIPFDAVDSVRVITVYRGKKPLEFQCVLYSKEDCMLADIEHVKKNAQEALEKRAKKAAYFIGCKLEYANL